MSDSTAPAAPRAIEYLPLTDLRPNPRNPKSHDLETIDDSVGRFGYVEPIIRDDRTGFIVSGHGRTKTLHAMHERGESPPEGVLVDEAGHWLVPVTVGWSSRTDTEAAAALIALNRTTELGGWVDDALLDMLDDLADIEGGLDGVGFEESEIEALRERLSGLGEDEIEGGEDEEEGGVSEGRGALLDIADLSAGEPTHEVHQGQVWRVGPHVLVVANPHRDWKLFVPYLRGDVLFAPYPDIYLPMTDTAQNLPLVMVQPNLYLAGHLLDKYTAVYPEATVEQVIDK